MTEFRSLVDLASDAAMAIDGGLRVVAWNERAEGFLGYAAKEALDRPCCDLLQATLPDGKPLCMPECAGDHCFRQHVPFSVPDCYLRHKDGGRRRATISTLVVPTPSDGRAFPSTVAVILLRPHGGNPQAVPPDGQLRILTFGRFELSANGRELSVHRWYRRHALTLMKILVTNRREVLHREQLIAHLWPEADDRRGRERLKVTTHFLRKQLRGAGLEDDIVTVAGPTYSVNGRSAWIDCEAFERLCDEGCRLSQRGRRREALTSFERAAQLYRGDYLVEDLYAEWCAEERERLRESYLDVLGHIVDGRLDRGDFEEAAVVCRRGLSHDPCREGFHRALMICLARLGQRDRLIAHYEHCCKTLKTELGVEPTPETERLFRALVAGREPNTSYARSPR